MTLDIYGRQAGGNILQMDKVEPLWNGAHVTQMNSREDIEDQMYLLDENKANMTDSQYYTQRRRIRMYQGILRTNAQEKK